MKEQKEIRISLNEVNFTAVCKEGSITYGSGYNKAVIYISKVDMKKLATGEVVEFTILEHPVFLVSVQDIGLEMIKEILKRSTMYSDMYYEI